jgi:hypothetical protein
LTSPVTVQADHAMLAAAMSAKDGRLRKQDVIELIERVASLVPHDLRRRAAVRAFAHRILLVGDPSDSVVRFAGEELHAFLLEDGERMAAE